MNSRIESDRAGDAVFDLTRFLDGQSTAWGMFEDRTGRVRRRFTVELSGRWDGPLFVVEEHFVFDDGEVDRRVWRFARHNGGRFTATCDDVVGQADGRFEAECARMRYSFRMQVGGRGLTVDIDDRFYPLDKDRVINRATVSKFGFRLGEITIYFDRDLARGKALLASDRRAAA